MAFLAPIAASVLSGPLGSVVGGIVGNIGQNLLGSGGGIGGLVNQAFSGIGGAFKKLFGRKKKRRLPQFPPRPLPWSPGCGNSTININNTYNNPLGNLGNLGNSLGAILGQLGNLLGQLQSGFSGSAPASGGTGGPPGIFPPPPSGGPYGNLDAMFSDAEKLMKSDKPSDQLAGMQKMQQASRLFEALSKALEMKSAAQKTAIAAIR